MSKPVTYHISHTVTDNDGTITQFMSQQYKIGVYVIIDNNPSMQFNLEPKDIVKVEKNLKKQLAANKIKALEFGPSITVSDESGFWEKVNK